MSTGSGEKLDSEIRCKCGEILLSFRSDLREMFAEMRCPRCHEYRSLNIHEANVKLWQSICQGLVQVRHHGSITE